jgi:hypothetical protein
MRTRRMKAAARGTLSILGLALVSVAVLGTRYLVFEYSHGDREVVMTLLDKISP